MGAVSGQYRRSGESLEFVADVTITTNGTGSGAVTISLPDTANGQTATGVGRIMTAPGKTVVAVIASSTAVATVYMYDNTYPGADGARIVVSGSYRTT